MPAPVPRPPRQRDPDRSGHGMAIAGIGAALSMIICCARPYACRTPHPCR
jgi:hypothetical protein